MTVALEAFDPRIAEWFVERYGAPTEIQERAWPRIAAGENVLAVAPTGSGKTLTGFLWPLDRLLTVAWEGGGLRVLYVSPLKALNADIERNLRRPLAEIEEALRAAGEDPPALRVGVRSGDTPPAERARMLRRPPEILITTPESLNLLLLGKRARALFSGLRLVVLDEIHAVVGSKRGTHLIVAVDRLVRLAGEFQRLAISATVRPVETVARFVGGWRMERRPGGEATYRRRPVAVVEARGDKRYEIAVRLPPSLAAGPAGRPEGDEFWRAMAADLAARIGEVRSTLVFTNSRRLAEKTTRLVNEAAGREVAWSHHGSLSREIRTAVERRLQEGSLPAVVATSSLELGIDVGALDRVLLLQTPRSLASAAQRIGRAGHAVGDVSRAVFYPTHPRDFLDAAVASRAVLEGEIEPLRPVRSPLDLLAQTILGVVAHERWQVDELYDFVRTSDPFHELSRVQFDLVLEMLAGRYADARIEELRPRVALDRLAGTVEGRPGTAQLLARSGGTIPDRGYFRLRLEEGGALLGELDEEFVWERSVGDAFVLGTQAWRIRSIGTHEVTVAPARSGALLAPFWRADARDRVAYFSERVAGLLERAEERLADPGSEGRLVTDLIQESGFEPEAAAELVRLLREERAALGVALPHRHHLVFEEAPERGGDASRRQVVLYTFWGGTVNRPLALALAGLWQEREGEPIEIVAEDDAVLLVLPPGADPVALLTALEPGRCEELLRARLEATGFFGAHFRQNAQRSLLLPRASPNRRTPLWISRQNAKKLLEAVSRHDDFPLVLETWRTCLADEFELGVLEERLREIATGKVRISTVRTSRPSPFAAQLLWRRTNTLMYEDDVPETRRASSLRGDLLREVALGATDRPAVPAALAERFRLKAQRLLPGYAPRDAPELLEWVKERLWIPLGEWRELLAAIDRDRVATEAGPDADGMVAEIAGKLVRWRPSPAPATDAVSALETALRLPGGSRLAGAFVATAAPLAPGIELEADPVALATASGAPVTRGVPAPAPEAGEAEALAAAVVQVLPFYGSFSVAGLAEELGVELEELEKALEVLVRAERAVVGELIEGAEERQVAARSAFETLLRWQRSSGRAEAALEPLPVAALPLFVASRQGLVERAADVDGLKRALEKLFGVALPAGLWEREVLPARLEGYATSWLDALFEDSDLVWYGGGRERVGFAFRGDLDLFVEGGAAATPFGERVLDALAAAPRGASLGDLAEELGAPTGEVSRSLWELAWQGSVACDSMKALRAGIRSRFEPATDPVAATAARGPRRGAFRRWQGSRPFPGRWFRIPPRREPDDPLLEEERQRERARLLLDRWGVVCRELLALEGPRLSWGRLSRTLRVLELSGEIVGGRFFTGLGGLQFVTPATLEKLRSGMLAELSSGAVWWLSAADPASLAGAEIAPLRGGLPRRTATSQVVWRGAETALEIRRSGRELDFRLPRDAGLDAALLAPLRNALTRSFEPERSLLVEHIDGGSAAESDRREAFACFAVSRELAGLKLRRRWS